MARMFTKKGKPVCPFCDEKINHHEDKYHLANWCCDEWPEDWVICYYVGSHKRITIFDRNDKWYLYTEWLNEENWVESVKLEEYSVSQHWSGIVDQLNKERAEKAARIRKIDAFFRMCQETEKEGKTAEQLFKK